MSTKDVSLPPMPELKVNPNKVVAADPPRNAVADPEVILPTDLAPSKVPSEWNGELQDMVVSAYFDSLREAGGEHGSHRDIRYALETYALLQEKCGLDPLAVARKIHGENPMTPDIHGFPMVVYKGAPMSLDPEWFQHGVPTGGRSALVKRPSGLSKGALAARLAKQGG